MTELHYTTIHLHRHRGDPMKQTIATLAVAVLALTSCGGNGNSESQLDVWWETMTIDVRLGACTVLAFFTPTGLVEMIDENGGLDDTDPDYPELDMSNVSTVELVDYLTVRCDL